MQRDETIAMTAWQPSASIAALKQRAQIIQQIRTFFAQRNVLEVETPLICEHTVSDPYLNSFTCVDPTNQQTLGFLQTSPEYAMKRLLAAGSGDIFEITKAFRQGEAGKQHHPEFTMLEWYRVGFDHHTLMDEVDSLLQLILGVPAGERVSYSQAFENTLHLNPHTATVEALSHAAQQTDATIHFEQRDDWLDFLFGHVIGPGLGHGKPTFLYDFPASQAALARIRPDTPPVAERFEVFVNGIELANGYHELNDPVEQEKRFTDDLAKREQLGAAGIPIDTKLLAALQHGMPACAGVALGLDRLLMLALGVSNIAQVMSFTDPLSHLHDTA